MNNKFIEIDQLIKEYCKDPMREAEIQKARKRVKKWIRRFKFKDNLKSKDETE